METVTGIFRTRAEAEKAVQQLHSLGIKNDRLALLTPDFDRENIEKDVAVEDSEPPGIGKAMGGTVGGAMGAAGGATLGAAAASLLIPGVGPVIAGTILGAAILGTGGAVTGVAVGGALEDALAEGMPRDEVYLYEDALQHGRSVVIAFVEADESKEAARGVLAQAGAEGIDEARENWWLGLRDSEELHYETAGHNFKHDEASYRRGFEAALCGATESDEVPGDAYQRGYERGLAYRQSLRERHTR